MKTPMILAMLAFVCLGSSPAPALTLKDCLAKAAAANTQLRAAAYDERIAAEGVNIATSGYLPRVDLQAGYVAQQAPQAVRFGQQSLPTQQADYAFANLAIYQTLYDFGRTSARREQAKLTREAVQQNYRGEEQDVFLQVVQAYYGILAGEKYLTTAEDEVRQMTHHRKVAQDMYEQGVVTRNDLLQAQVKLANSRQKRLSAANSLDNSWLYLNFLTGQAPAFRSDLEEPAQHTETADLDMMMAIALRKRPEIAALKKTIQADEAVVRENKSNYYPEIFAKLGLDYLENDKVQEQTIMSATVGIKINLFDGLATTARKRQALQIKSREEERLRNLEASVRLELQAAMNDLKVAEERIAVSEVAIRQSEENLRINSDRYQEKVGTATDVIDAQTLLTQTRNDYFRSVFDYQVAAARVKRAVGEL
ncbi:TolC family protein [Geotalea sp. SG265]|uniref:TolC family protein n=1 Tax=Geotalea sp. SG265 TaxID=2922867 RepID=UPI001FB03882|nr:TolC family protein [Geotalea sp. SG265]